jgi:hypothetical protein
LRSVAKPITLAGAMALVILGCQAALHPIDVPGVVELVVLVLVGGATYGTLAFVFARESLREVSRFFRRR